MKTPYPFSFTSRNHSFLVLFLLLLLCLIVFAPFFFFVTFFSNRKPRPKVCWGHLLFATKRIKTSHSFFRCVFFFLVCSKQSSGRSHQSFLFLPHDHATKKKKKVKAKKESNLRKAKKKNKTTSRETKQKAKTHTRTKKMIFDGCSQVEWSHPFLLNWVMDFLISLTSAFFVREHVSRSELFLQTGTLQRAGWNPWSTHTWKHMKGRSKKERTFCFSFYLGTWFRLQRKR